MAEEVETDKKVPRSQCVLGRRIISVSSRQSPGEVLICPVESALEKYVAAT